MARAYVWTALVSALGVVLLFVLAGCSAGLPEGTPTPVPTNTPAATNTPRATNTPKATNTPRATSTPRPTSTPKASPTPDLEKTYVALQQTATAYAVIVYATSTAEAQLASPTPTTKTFTFIDRTDYSDSYGTYLVGVIRYNGDEAMERPDIVGTLEDKDHNPLATEKAQYAPDVVFPDGLIPYRIEFADPPDNWEFSTVVIQAGDTVSDSTTHTGSFDFPKANLVASTTGVSGPKLVGSVRYTGTEGFASSVKVIAVAYDKQGKVVDVQEADAALSQIGPNETSPFSIEFRSEKEVDSADVVASGVLNK